MERKIKAVRMHRTLGSLHALGTSFLLTLTVGSFSGAEPVPSGVLTALAVLGALFAMHQVVAWRVSKKIAANPWPSAPDQRSAT